MWFFKLIRSFFFLIDSIVYGFIPTVYNWIMTVSRLTILSQGQIKEFINRIQLLIGVFMLFKVAFSIITYVINPDEMSDKSKGFAKLGQNAIISLVLLVVTPYIFGMAYDLQGMILEDNSLATLLFGNALGTESNFTNQGGQMIAYSAMINFFTPEVNNDSVGLVTSSKLTSCYHFINSDGTFNEDCKNAIREEVNGILFEEEDDTVIGNYALAVEQKNFNLLFRYDAVVMTTNWNLEFVFSYKFLLSTIVGAIILLILISFLLDISLRSVKLAFLQFIYPIPIISYMDPKSGKDGMFKKWYTMCFSTYVSLFVRLLALYFGIYLISIVINNGPIDTVTGETVNDFGVKLIMIIGILMFAKQLPKILEGFGIKLDGGGKFHLNPFKKVEEEAFGGKQILGAAGGLVSGIADRGARIIGATNRQERRAAIAGSLVGIPGAALRGFRDGKGFTSGMKAQNAVNRRLRDGRIKGLTPAQSYLDYAGSLFGLDDATLERESRINYINDETLKDMKRRAEEASRNETLRANELEHQNAQRKETIQRLSDAQTKGDAVMKHVEEYTKKKANYGRFSGSDAMLFRYLMSNVGSRLSRNINFSNGFKLKSGDNIDNTTLDKLSNSFALTNDNRNDAMAFAEATSTGIGNALTRDINLSDGTRIAAGEIVDNSMLSRIRGYFDVDKNYTRTININNNNLEMLRKMQQNGQSISATAPVTIGSKTFSGDVTAEKVEEARQAAYDYEKSAIEQVQNLFASRVIGGTDQNEFDSKRSEYETAVTSVNESIDAYNSTYRASVAYVNDSVEYRTLDNTIKDLSSGVDVRAMRSASSSVESEIVRHKQNAANAKDHVKGHLLDERGNVVMDPSTGREKEYGIDEFESNHNPRMEATKAAKEQHSERRSQWQNLSNK